MSDQPRCLQCKQALRLCHSGTEVCSGAGWTHEATDSHFCDYQRGSARFGERVALSSPSYRIKSRMPRITGVFE